ncbi:hypothetical protein H1R20_g14345, partial [Candolleomyces eurysporus]
MSSLPPSAAAGSSAEAQAAAFADDPRVYFNKSTNTWRLEQDDETELEYDSVKGAWVPVLDEDLLKRQQAAYSVAGVDEETPAAPVLKRENKKRKVEDYTGYGNGNGNGEASSSSAAAGPSAKRGKSDKPGERKSKNTAVYVTGLPTDTEPDELVERFSKCGVIEEDDSGDPKIKMYAREDGSFNGEALIVYFKEDSVILALNLLDEAELRLGQPSTVMKVAKADFSHKGSSSTHGGGQHQPRKTIDKKAATRRIGKMQRKLEEWGDDDGFGPQPDPSDRLAAPSQSRVVVLKHMFKLEDLEKDATLLLDLKEDVREECSNLGEVTNVTLYDNEPDGVITVKFRDPVSAAACVIKMNGRYFDGQRVIAELYTGRQRFKRTGGGDEIGEGGDEEEKRRLEQFSQWLMDEGE